MHDTHLLNNNNYLNSYEEIFGISKYDFEKPFFDNKFISRLPVNKFNL